MMWKGCGGNLLPQISTRVPAVADQIAREKEKSFLDYWVPEQDLIIRSAPEKTWTPTQQVLQLSGVLLQAANSRSAQQNAK